MEVGEEKADKQTKEKQQTCCFLVSSFCDGFFFAFTEKRGVSKKMGFFLKNVLVLLIKGQSAGGSFVRHVLFILYI
jgi:hypothetical protein